MQVVFKSGSDSPHSVDVSQGERLLLAGLRSGIGLPYECATGTCGTCVAEVESGLVHRLWPEAPGNSALKGSSSRILLCQTAAAGDCSLVLRSLAQDEISRLPRPGHGRGVVKSAGRLAEGLFEISLRCDRPFDCLPGQFVLLAAEGIPGYRAYSVSALEDHGLLLRLVVRRGHDSGLAAALCDRLVEPASALRLFGPLGKACIRPGEQGPVAVVVGGSGLGVAMAIATHVLREPLTGGNPLHLHIGMRDADCEPVLEWMASLQRTSPSNLHATVSFSQDAGAAPFPVTHRHGDVHIAALEAADSWDSSTRIFVAGPPPMVDATARGLMRLRKFPIENLRFDRFS